MRMGKEELGPHRHRREPGIFHSSFPRGAKTSMRMSLSAEGVAWTTTRQKAGRDLKTPAPSARNGGNATGNLKAPAGMVSALRIFACGKESLERDSQDWALANVVHAAARKEAAKILFMYRSWTTSEMRSQRAKT